MLGLGARRRRPRARRRGRRAASGCGVERTRCCCSATAIVLTGGRGRERGADRLRRVHLAAHRPPPGPARRASRDLLLTSPRPAARARPGRGPRRADAVLADRDPGRDRHVRHRGAVLPGAPAARAPDRGGRMSDAPLRAERPDRRLRRRGRRRARSTWRSRGGAITASSAPTAAASRRCCARSRGCSSRARARVLLDGRGDPRPARPATVARRLGMLPAVAGRARRAHRRGPRRPRPLPAPGPVPPVVGAGRASAVAEALAATGTPSSPTARVDELSGGQRQRAWIAMALAQETDAAAARRADDLPRPRAPGRRPRPARRPHRRARPHGRDGAARPQPGLPLRRPPRRAARRRVHRRRPRPATSSTPRSSRRSSALEARRSSRTP